MMPSRLPSAMMPGTALSNAAAGAEAIAEYARRAGLRHRIADDAINPCRAVDDPAAVARCHGWSPRLVSCPAIVQNFSSLSNIGGPTDHASRACAKHEKIAP